MSDRIYLDYAAATPLDRRVEKSMEQVDKFWANPSSLHKEGREARAVVDEARSKIASILNVKTKNIVFTSGATESNVLTVRGVLEYYRLKKGKPHMVVSKIEHPSIKEPVEQLERMGMEVTWLSVDENGLVDVDELVDAVKENTALVSIIYGNHEVGVVQKIGELVDAVKQKNSNTLFHTDAAQTLGWLKFNIKELGVDLLTASGYKLYGPKGVGFLYINDDVKLQPIFPGFQEWGKRAGTEPIVLINGLAKALELSVDWPRDEVEEMRNGLVKEVASRIDGVRVNTYIQQSVPHIAHFSFEGIDSQLLTIALDQDGLAASPSSACSSGAVRVSHIVKALNINTEKYSGSLRLSIGKDTKSREVEKAARILEKTVKELKSKIK